MVYVFALDDVVLFHGFQSESHVFIFFKGSDFDVTKCAYTQKLGSYLESCSTLLTQPIAFQ